MGNKGADIYLLAGDQDTNCPAWQSQQLASALCDAGYHVDLIQLTGADHYAPIFHEVRNGQFQVVTTDASWRTRQARSSTAMPTVHESPRRVW